MFSCFAAHSIAMGRALSPGWLLGALTIVVCWFNHIIMRSKKPRLFFVHLNTVFELSHNSVSYCTCLTPQEIEDIK